MCVSDYFKELESQIFRVGIKETNKEKMKRFVNDLRRDVQEQVELMDVFGVGEEEDPWKTPRSR